MRDQGVDELDGFRVGDIVWQQMYSPVYPSPNSMIEERIAAGVLYGPRRLMRLAGIIENYDSTEYVRALGVESEPRLVTRWWLVDPEQPNEHSRMSWVDSDWCVLEHAHNDVGMLF